MIEYETIYAVICIIGIKYGIMQRIKNGKYEITSVGGEQVWAFIPAPLYPDPSLTLDGPLRQALESASLSLGRLDGMALLLPEKTLLRDIFVRKEAVLSSRIEGTQSSLSDLLLFEMDEAPGVPFNDVVEVSNHVAALEHGMRRLREDFPLSNRLIREVHDVLMRRGRGSNQAPGEFRRSQNWIGGTRPGNAVFVPPPHTAVLDCMSALERFLHHTADGLPILVRAGLAHVQFETIHPFLDGNGRVGRLLITLLLCHYGALREPLLYLSLYFKRHRAHYYDLLNRTRRTGDWEAWLAFFLEGVQTTAENAVLTAQRLSDMFQQDRARIETFAGRRAGSVLRVHEALQAHPILSLPAACERTGLSFRTAASAMELLAEHRIAREITGKQRGRLFVYDQYLAALDEGSEAE